ncbi:MAG: TetR/AcrR family transcriptional regulator [Ornithinimicrobium sp.]
MPRPARFTDDDILDAALTCVAEAGPSITIASIAAHLDGPVGSIYHRFPSRDVLVIRLWMRSVERFQAGLFELADMPSAHDALVAMALHIPRYCRAHHDEAASLTLYRQERLLVDCPDEVRAEVTSLNDDLLALMNTMTTRRYGQSGPRVRELIVMATRIAPYGLVRPYLGASIPCSVDEAVATSTDAILRLGDRAAGPGA